MRTDTVLATLAAVLPAFAAPAPVTTSSASACPVINGTTRTSNNNIKYGVTCSTDLSTKVLRTTQTFVGVDGCLTACDGTVGCDSVTFVASNDAETEGFCYVRTHGKTHAAGSKTAIAVRLPGEGPTTTITTWPTALVPGASTVSSASARATIESFYGLAIRSGSDIQYASIDANGTRILLNGGTSSYCPDVSGIDCSGFSNSTIFSKSSASSTLSLDVAVAGGQQVYVDATGALRFTSPHSAYTGTGSSSTGFGLVDGGLHLRYNGSGFLACPLGAAHGNAYQVYAAGAVNVGDACEGFEFRTSQATGPSAYEYS